MHRLTSTLAAATAILALLLSAPAATASPGDIDSLTRQADQVFEGRVEAVTEVRVGRHATLYNDYRVRIHRVLDGDAAEGTRIIVRERVAVPAPAVRKRSRRSSRRAAKAEPPTAQLVAGQTVVLFVASAERGGAATLVRGAEGAWLIDATSQAEPVAYPVLDQAGSGTPNIASGVELATLAARVEAASR